MQTTLIAATSLDGFIAPHTADTSPSTIWTSREDTQWFKSKTMDIGTLIMGRKTHQTIPPHLTPLKDRVSIIMSASAPDTLTDTISLEKNHAYTSALNPSDLLTALDERGVEEVAICGGTSVYTQFLSQNLVNKIFFTIEPVLFGTGVPLSDKELSTKIRFVAIHHLSSQTKVVEYDVVS